MLYYSTVLSSTILYYLGPDTVLVLSRRLGLASRAAVVADSAGIYVRVVPPQSQIVQSGLEECFVGEASWLLPRRP